MTEKILTTFKGFKDFFTAHKVAYEVVPMFREMKAGDYFSEMINVHCHYDEKLVCSLIFDKNGELKNFVQGLGFGIMADEIEYDTDNDALLIYHGCVLIGGFSLQTKV